MSTLSTSSLRSLGLPARTLKALDRKARARGKTAQEYVKGLIRADLFADQSFDEILKPIRDGFRASGLDEGAIDRLVDRARKATAKQHRGGRR